MASEDRLNLILNKVATRLGTATGIGQVHRYLRWATSDAAFEQMAVTSGVINFWQVTRLSTQSRWLTTGSIWKVHTLAIYGAYGLLDASATEVTFQALIERVQNRFETFAAWTLDDTVESIAPYMGELASTSPTLGAIGGIQVVSLEHRNLNNKLAHWCDLRLSVQDLPQRLPD